MLEPCVLECCVYSVGGGSDVFKKFGEVELLPVCVVVMHCP
jgi:hypothetical protein